MPKRKEKNNNAAEKESMEKLVGLMNRMGEELGKVSKNNTWKGLLESGGHHKEANDLRDAEEVVEDWLQAVMEGLLCGELEIPVTYEDPDQSSLKGYSRKGMIEKHKWVSGMDYKPHLRFLTHFSDWMINIYMGNYDKFMEEVNSLTKEDLEERLKMRETLLKVGAIFHVVKGAREMFPGSPILLQTVAARGRFDGEHLKILHKLLELGVDVNVHDVAGYTPLHHCLTNQCNSTTFEMAKLLLAHGANPNAVNRFGNPPLCECIIASNADAVKLLMEHKADPYITDNDGVNPVRMCKLLPAMAKLLTIKDSRDIRRERKRNEAVNPDFKKCTVCLKTTTKKCSGCQVEYYCSIECQRDDWNEHKGPCKERRNKYLPVEVTQPTGFAANLNYKSGKVQVLEKTKTKKTHFVVKIQVPLVPNSSDAMLVYDKSRSFNGFISTTTTNGAKLSEIVKTKGFRGIKGFFNAVKENGQISISPEILLPENW